VVGVGPCSCAAACALPLPLSRLICPRGYVQLLQNRRRGRSRKARKRGASEDALISERQRRGGGGGGGGRGGGPRPGPRGGGPQSHGQPSRHIPLDHCDPRVYGMHDSSAAKLTNAAAAASRSATRPPGTPGACICACACACACVCACACACVCACACECACACACSCCLLPMPPRTLRLVLCAPNHQLRECASRRSARVRAHVFPQEPPHGACFRGGGGGGVIAKAPLPILTVHLVRAIYVLWPLPSP
jgi:hypothetical protein